MRRLFVPVFLLVLGLAAGLWLGRRVAPPDAAAPDRAPERAPLSGAASVSMPTPPAPVIPAAPTAASAVAAPSSSSLAAPAAPAPTPGDVSDADAVAELKRMIAGLDAREKTGSVKTGSDEAGREVLLAGLGGGRVFDARFAVREDRRAALGMSVIEAERLRTELDVIWRDAQALARANITLRESLTNGGTRVTIEHHAAEAAPLRGRVDALLESVGALDAETRAELTLELDHRFNDWGAGTRIVTVTLEPVADVGARPYIKVKDEFVVRTPESSRTRVTMRSAPELAEEYRVLIEPAPADGAANLELTP